MFGGETFTNFSINFNALNAHVTFSSGDVVSGQITFCLKKDVTIQSMAVRVQGRVKVLWTTRHGSGKRRRTTTHSARIQLFSLNHVLQFSNGTPSAVLKQGTHVYPFSAMLPRGNFPTSFRGVHGKVVYDVTVSIHRAWRMVKEFKTPINFINHIDANDPQYLTPHSAANSKTVCCFCCASGDITMHSHLERKGFVPGETVKIMLNIENSSSRAVTPKATLVQKQTFFTISRNTRRIVPRQLARTAGQTISPNTADASVELMLEIPSDAPCTIANCQIIEVDYTLLVSLHISGGATSLEILFPIVLCNIPVHQPHITQPTFSQPENMQTQVNPFPDFPPPAYSDLMM